MNDSQTTELLGQIREKQLGIAPLAENHGIGDTFDERIEHAATCDPLDFPDAVFDLIVKLMEQLAETQAEVGFLSRPSSSTSKESIHA
jgi:hypothetical protein